MATSKLPAETIIAMLAEAPERIAATTDGLSPQELRQRPAPDEWSITEILAHLRACADMWDDRGIDLLLAEDNPTFRAINPTTWIERTDYPDLEFAPSFAAFAAQRAELVATLRALAPDDWDRAGTATGAGAPIRRTVAAFAGRIAVHERAHLKQIGRVTTTLRGS